MYLNQYSTPYYELYTIYFDTNKCVILWSNHRSNANIQVTFINFTQHTREFDLIHKYDSTK